jgi:3-hydroxyisobutyrate dehydrogenase
MKSLRDLKIGFIGLGNMGSAMARRLVAAGVEPYLWNRSQVRLTPFRGTNAHICASAEIVLERSDLILLMLSDDDAVAAVLNLRQSGARPPLANKIIVNMGTGAPARALSHQAAVAALGGTYVEAPVSGSRQPAEAGRLLAMIAGGTSAQRAMVGSAIAPLCRASIEVGAVPQALQMKLAVNLYLVTSVAALAEAFHLADRLGIQPLRFAEVLAASPMASEVSRGKGEKIARRDFSVQAAISDVHKNCRLVADAAAEAGASTPLLAQARALFAVRDGKDGSKVDMASIIDTFKPKEASAAPRVVARQFEAYQRKDLAALMACWAENAIVVGPGGTVLASAADAIRERHRRRFGDKMLDARLLTRTAVGDMVVDEELVRRTDEVGNVEEVRVLATYRVHKELIVSAAFAEEPVNGQ